MGNLIEFKRVIVHGGRSHFDERLATALALAANNCIVPVYRREPTPAELEDQETLVLDVGGRVDNWSNVFDHHQLPRDAAPECSFSLVAKELGVAEDLRCFFGWFATWRQIDSSGPFQWAKAHGVDWSVASTLLNPDMDVVSDWWEESSGETPVDEVLVRRLKKQGEKILETAEAFKAFSEKADAKGLPAEVAGVAVFDFREFTPQEAQRFGLAYVRSKGANCGVVVSNDDRGPGYAYLRVNDDPRIDFSQCKDKPYCGFAHMNGFLLKTKDRNVSNVEVIVDAKKAPPKREVPDYARLG